MGNMKDMLGMIPGVGSKVKDMDINEDSFKGIEAMINSMTPEERADPDLIDGNRKKNCQRKWQRHSGSEQLYEAI
jgi:signal recognition particle subunit SRP54